MSTSACCTAVAPEPEPPYWRYLGRKPRVRHALARSDDAVALCGTWSIPALNWRGTGSQDEYETVAALPKCRRCQRRLGDHPGWRHALTD